eukprot:7044524-Prymnesium_polylepis.1
MLPQSQEEPAPPTPDALPLPPPRWLPSRPTAAAPAPSADDLTPMLQQLTLRQSLRPPRRKLLVLDCNGLLFWRARKGTTDLSKLPRGPDATSGQFAIFSRPHLYEFLQWCTQRFVVVVWSTAKRQNLDPMVKLAFQGLPPPALVLDQHDCTPTGQFDGDRPLMLKELARLWAHPQLLAAAGQYVHTLAHILARALPAPSATGDDCAEGLTSNCDAGTARPTRFSSMTRPTRRRATPSTLPSTRTSGVGRRTPAPTPRTASVQRASCAACSRRSLPRTTCGPWCARSSQIRALSSAAGATRPIAPSSAASRATSLPPSQ